MDYAVAQWTLLFLAVACALGMAVLPLLLYLMIRLELKTEQGLKSQQEQINKLDAAMASVLSSAGLRPSNDRVFSEGVKRCF